MALPTPANARAHVRRGCFGFGAKTLRIFVFGVIVFLYLLSPKPRYTASTEYEVEESAFRNEVNTEENPILASDPEIVREEVIIPSLPDEPIHILEPEASVPDIPITDDEHLDLEDGTVGDASAIANLPRPPRSPTHSRYLTVATLMKNQRRWLREWIEFYLMMGVEHFLIYDNNSTDFPLEILQHYIDRGVVTYIPWPPIEAPPPWNFKNALEEWQYGWFNDTLQTCILDMWTIHRQVPCQCAAYADAVNRTKGGVSRWLGIFDIDEYIYPRPRSGFTRLVDLFRARYPDHDHLRIYGNTFGTSGHVEQAAHRRPGDDLHALLTESYIYRADQNGTPPHERKLIVAEAEHPYANVEHSITVHGIGHLAEYTFSGAASYVVKYFADPDRVVNCMVHTCAATWPWRSDYLWLTDDTLKFNHYAFLSQADARRKSENNKNPFITTYGPEFDEYFSRVEDTEIQFYLAELKERMLRSIREDPPVRPDDWQPLPYSNRTGS